MTDPPPLSPLRIFFIVIGVLTVMISGGCALIFGLPAIAYGKGHLVLLYGGVPIALGVLILWLVANWRRGEGGAKRKGEGGSSD